LPLAATSIVLFILCASCWRFWPVPKRATVFVFSERKQKCLIPLAADTLDNAFKRLVAGVLGLDAALFSIHSLRRSGATALHLFGADEATIKQIGRWASLAWLRYVIVAVASIIKAQTDIGPAQ
jgi:hypothetical protein